MQGPSTLAVSENGFRTLVAPDRERLLAAAREVAGVGPRATARTPFDGVYQVGRDLLLFTGSFPDPAGELLARGVMVPRWDAGAAGGREGLVPPLRFYHDHDSLLFSCALAYMLDAPLAIHGHTGVGKTELVRYFAALLGAPLYRMNLHGLSTTDDIIGKLVPSGGGAVWFQDGLVTTAVRRGGVLLLEEMNATGQEVWFALHGLLDGSRALTLVEKDNEVIHQHPRCRIFATFNPAEYPDLYPGTKELSAAYLRRWASVRLEFMEIDMERAILLERFPAFAEPEHEDILETMLQVARVSREMLLNRSRAFNFVFSTGTLEAWASFVPHVGPVAAAKMAFYDLLDDRLKAIFREQVFSYVTPWDLTRLDRPRR
jgi:MoxR-like ATPase